MQLFAELNARWSLRGMRRLLNWAMYAVRVRVTVQSPSHRSIALPYRLIAQSDSLSKRLEFILYDVVCG